MGEIGRAETAAVFERLCVAMHRLTVTGGGVSLTAASTLARLDRLGPQRLCRLASAEKVTQPAMTQLVSRLEREGLASRLHDPADGRVVLVAVTADGRDLVLQRQRVRAERLSQLLDGLTEADRAAIAAALPALDRLGRLVSPDPDRDR